MKNGTGSFFLKGPTDDLAYTNVRDSPRHEDTRQFISNLWHLYKPFADLHFRDDAKNHFLERFWEMYLAVTFIDRGFNIQRSGDEGPEFFVEQGNKRIWVEAVAPGAGVGPDRVLEPELGVAHTVPTEKILLRFTQALIEKRNRYKDALQKEIISPDDGYLLAVNSNLIPHARFGNAMPYLVQAYLPIGPYSASIDRESWKIVDTFYQRRESVSKLSGAEVSTTALLDPEYAFVSAVIHSAVDCVNRPQELGGDFCVLHNEKTNHSIGKNLFQWASQIALIGDKLITSEPGEPFNLHPPTPRNP